MTFLDQIRVLLVSEFHSHRNLLHESGSSILDRCEMRFGGVAFPTQCLRRIWNNRIYHIDERGRSFLHFSLFEEFVDALQSSVNLQHHGVEAWHRVRVCRE